MFDAILNLLLFYTLFFGVPILMILFFAISLARYRTAKKKNQETPGTYSPTELKKRKAFLIVASVVFGVLVVVVIGFMVLLNMALMNM